MADAEESTQPPEPKRRREARRRKPLLEPPTRTLLDWTPGHRRAALALAESGQLRMAADLCEAMFADDRVAGCMGTLIRGLFSLPLSFEEGSGPGRKKAAVKALEAGEDFWTAYPEQDLVELAQWAVGLGVALGEHVWAEQPSGRLVQRLKVWHPRWLRFDWPLRKWFVTVDGGQEVEVTPGDGRWILLTPYGAHRPWAFGLWRALSLCWLAKYFSVQDWSRHNEVHGAPIAVAESPEGAHEEDWDAAAADLANLGGRTAMALPPGFKAVLLEAKAATFKTFAEQIEWADRAIAILLLGQNLTTEVDAGSLAAAEVHKRVLQHVLRATASWLATGLREQGLTWWAEFNFGSRDLAPWPAWDTDPPEDKAALAATWGQAATALSALAGLLGEAFDMAEAVRRFDLPVRAGVDVNALADQMAAEKKAQEQARFEAETSALAAKGKPADE